MKKILLICLIVLLLISSIVLVFLFSKNTEDVQSGDTTEVYTLNENLIFEDNLEEIIKQGDIVKVEPNGNGDDLYIRSTFGNSNVVGSYVYMVRDGKIAKTYFYSTCSFTKYFDTNYSEINAEESMNEIMNMEKDNLDKVYEMARGIYNECTENYGITNFTTATKDPSTHDDVIKPNCHNVDEFISALKPLINGETMQAVFMGFDSDGHCYRITISNAQLFLAFNVEAFE